MRRNRRNSAARNLNEKDPEIVEFVRHLSLSLSLLSLAFRSICWVSEEKEEGKRSLLSHVLEIVIFELKRAKHFHTILSLVFTLVSLILLTSYVLPLSFGKKYICMLVRESEHIYIYILYMCVKKEDQWERVLVTVIRSEFTRFIDTPIIACHSKRRTNDD